MVYNGFITADERGNDMRGFKKVLGIALALALLLTVLYPVLQTVAAAEFILEPSQLQGSDYTDSDKLAKALDEVFAGDIDIYSDGAFTLEVSMPVGISMSNSTQYYVKSQTSGNPISGWQCYIYGNAVYNKLFREWVGHANGFAHSQTVIPGGRNELSYEVMQQAGVRCGAYLRTTGNSDGSYSSNVGHSMIILTYDRDTITYLEGNGDGNGLIRVTIRTWDDFNLRQLSGRGRYIAHMVQPTEEVYQSQYPSCTHEGYDGVGVCADCGAVYDWQSTLDPWAKGIYRLTEKVTPRSDGPYSAATAASLTLLKDQKIQTTGQYRNAFDQIWYSAQDDAGNTFYINGASLKFVEYLPLEATCKDFSPEDGAELEQKSYPVKGTVSANYPLKSISGYLDGELYATWTAENETTTQVDLRQTDLNHKLTFSKLEGGRHQVMVVVWSYVHGQAVTVHESEFFTVSPEPCSHDYTGTVTLDATCTEDGLLTYTCSKCGDAYTRTIAAHGHDYQQNVCTYCADRLILANLSGKILAGGKAGEPLKITLTQEGQEVYTVTVSTDAYSLTELLPGTYTVMAAKSDCVPLTAELTLEPGDSTFDIKVCVPGDLNGDRNLNIGDVGKLYAHIRKTSMLEDPYGLLCADYNADGIINIGDAGKLYGTLRKK